MNSDLSGDEDSFGYNLSDDEGSATADDEDEDDATSIKFNAISDQPEREEAGLEEEEAGGMAVFSQALLTENVEKGKAARKQISKIYGTDRQTCRQTDRHADRQTDRHADRQTACRQTDRQTDMQTDRQTACRQADRQDRHADRQTACRQTDKRVDGG